MALDDFHQIQALPFRSPLGSWGSILGFVMIIAAIFETNSRVALISGAVFMIVLTAAYFLLKKQRDKRTID